MEEKQQPVTWKYADPQLSSGSAEVLRTIRAAGYEAYWVGGCVRDEYMGRAVSDMDITTSARPEVTCELFSKVIPTGMQHGTVTVMIEGMPYEVTTYRIESGYEDHRRPEQVEFVTDIEQDLQRRDFTMNAMALGLDGEWIDPFGGREDIDNRLVRCVGDARLRFREDALRMIRCIRFASVFGFAISFSTWRGIMTERDTLSWVAMERIRTELDKMMAGPDPLRGLELLARSGLYSRWKSPFPYAGSDMKWIKVIPSIPAADVDTRWAIFLYACGISAVRADDFLREWTFSNRRRVFITALLSIQESWTSFQDQERSSYDEQAEEAVRLYWIRLVLKHGTAMSGAWLDVQEIARSSGAGETGISTDVMRKWMKDMPVTGLKELQITGKDLVQALQKRGGPWLGDLLSHLLIQTAAGVLPNEEEKLIEEARRVLEA